MRHNTLRLLACAMAIGAVTVPFDTYAQPVNVDAVLILSSAITLTWVTDMDFGEWLFLAGDDASSLLLAPGGGITPTTGTNATLVEIVASANAGGVTLNTPGAADVSFFGTITTQIPDTNLTLGDLTYNLNGGGSTVLPGVTGTTILTTGAFDDVIGLGGTITTHATASPADGTHTGIVEITAEY